MLNNKPFLSLSVWPVNCQLSHHVVVPHNDIYQERDHTHVIVILTHSWIWGWTIEQTNILLSLLRFNSLQKPKWLLVSSQLVLTICQSLCEIFLSCPNDVQLFLTWWSIETQWSIYTTTYHMTSTWQSHDTYHLLGREPGVSELIAVKTLLRIISNCVVGKPLHYKMLQPTLELT